MYTQCIKCHTVFRLSAEVLRAAGGQVRCGRCGEVFNALARLAEDPATFPVGESPLEMEARANEILESAVPPLSQPGESSASDDGIIDIDNFDSNDVDFARLQLVEKFVEDLPQPNSAKAPAEVKAPTVPPRASPPPPAAPPHSVPPHSIPPHSVAPRSAAPLAAKPAVGAPAPASARPTLPKPKPAPTAAPTPPAATAPAARAAPAATKSPPRPTASVAPPPAPASSRAPPRGVIAPASVVPAKPAARKAPAASAAPPEARATTQHAEDSLDDGSMEFTLPPGELDRVFVGSKALVPETGEISEDGDIGEPGEPGETGETGEAAREDDTLRKHGAGLEVPEKVRREMLSGLSEPAPAALSGIPGMSEPRRRQAAFNAWVGAAILLGLLLCAQLIQNNREWFATHAPLRGSLSGVYAALGVAVAAPANLAAYQLRQWGVTGDPGASGTLRVRASILNTAAQLQPYPLLRVTLANRFGAKIGARDFEPAEYMGRPIVRMLAPGERADATLDIVDPGKDAEGFEIDVCVRAADQKISCAGDVATAAKQPASR